MARRITAFQDGEGKVHKALSHAVASDMGLLLNEKEKRGLDFSPAQIWKIIERRKSLIELLTELDRQEEAEI